MILVELEDWNLTLVDGGVNIVEVEAVGKQTEDFASVELVVDD